MTKPADIAHRMPSQGGSYMRLADGSLVQIETVTQPAPVGQPYAEDPVQADVEGPVKASAKPRKRRAVTIPADRPTADPVYAPNPATQPATEA